MENKVDKRSTWLAIISNILTPVLIAIIGLVGSLKLESIRSEISKSTLALETRKVDLERGRFDAEQHAQVDSVLAKYVPDVLHWDGWKHRPAIATLFVLYPNEAKNILSRIAQSVVHNPDYTPWFMPFVQLAESLDIMTGSWIVVIGSYPSLETAQSEGNRANQQGYTPVVIYKRHEWFVTTVGDFPNQREADRALIPIRAKIKDGAFVVNLHSWCPGSVKRNGYYECQSQ